MAANIYIVDFCGKIICTNPFSVTKEVTRIAGLSISDRKKNHHVNRFTRNLGLMVSPILRIDEYKRWMNTPSSEGRFERRIHSSGSNSLGISKRFNSV